MALIEKNIENFYTLHNENQLSRIIDLNNHLDWIKAINEIDIKLDNANQNEEVVLLYRGESREMFGSKTGIELGVSDDPYYDTFFVIGSKAKSYLLHKNESYIELKQFESDRKIRYIYNYLNRLSNRKELKMVLEVFNDYDRDTDFRKRLLSITNTDDRLTIENLYLAFIHTLSSTPEDINAHSVLVSSTRDVNVAKTFSNGGFIIAFWLSNPIQIQAIDYNRIGKYSELLAKYGLPKIEATLFPDESEVTIFSAIYPQNIFYVYDIRKRRIIFNPYIIKSDINNLITRGINVDQSHFDDKMKGIYSRSIWRSDRRLLYEKDTLNSV